MDDLPLRLDFSSLEERSFEVPQDQAGTRLDRFLATRLAPLSRAAVQRLIAEKLVRVNGGPGRAALRLRPGDRVIAGVPAVRPPGVDAQDLPLTILLECESFAVLDKAPGMAVHPGRGRPDGTIANAIAHRWGLVAEPGSAHRPGIVHRLDLETSGVMVIAKNDAAQARLAAAFKAREVEKEYDALVHGDPVFDEDRVELPLGRDLIHKTRMAVRFDGGRPSTTDLKVMARFGRAAHMLCRPLTGRTHQIRVHCLSRGQPLLGDTMYAGHREDPVPTPRLMLHARRLRFPHPVSGEPVVVEAPLPPDFRGVLEALRSTRGAT